MMKNILMQSSVHELDYILEIIFIVSLKRVIYLLLAVIKTNISKCNVMVLLHVLVINGFYFTNTLPKTIFIIWISVHECNYGFEIILIVSLHHIT